MKHKLGAVLAIALTSFLSSGALAQEATLKNFCGTAIPDEQWENEFQRLIKNKKAAAASGDKTQATVYTIPVIIHVIHGGQPVGTYPNLAQGQLNSQILVLNNDYAGTGFNSSNYPATAYSGWAANAPNILGSSIDANGRIKIANCEIQFCLATTDTLGNVLPEPGIHRVNYTTMPGWVNPGTISSYNNFKTFIDNTVKPQTIWNVTRYMNIWVTDSDINNVNLLGYATFPPMAGISGIPNNAAGTATTDGFWCYARAFGSITTFSTGTYYTGYTRGRTSTHEIGHWLGLRHIWGDGNCNATDYCDDTPPASSSNFGAPNYPFKANVCSGNSPNGEMFMNFMDYTNDPVKYMFTNDQAIRAQTAMANSPYRMFLGTHGLCTVSEVPVAASFNNSAVVCTGVSMQLINNSMGFPPATYTWATTGGTFTPGNTEASPTLDFSSPGTYVVTLSANNGTLSTISKTITVTSPAIMLAASAPTICAGNSSTLSVLSLGNYTWEPGGTIGFETVEAPMQSQTYTCSGKALNGCTSSSTITLFVSACTGINQQSAPDLAFVVYPNPANEWLHIHAGSYDATEVTVEISDALGKQVMSSQLSFNRAKAGQSLNIAQLENGLYLVKLKGADGRQQVIKFVKE